MTGRVQHVQAHIVAKIDLVPFVERALDAPLAPQHLALHRLGLRDPRRVAHLLKCLATEFIEVLLAVGVHGVGAMQTDTRARHLLHLGVATSVIGVHVRIDDHAQRRRIPADLFERRQQRRLRHAGRAGVDQCPARGVDQIAVDQAAVLERRRDLKDARVDACGEHMRPILPSTRKAAPSAGR